MITRLQGKLLECDLTEIVVDVQGVAFAVSVPMSTYDALPRPGVEVTVHTHLHVREDSMQLFGFATPEERALFRLLITVSGVGPRLALNVLSCMSVKSFCQAVIGGDAKALGRVNGIGKRSAERLIVELRERVEDIDPAAGLGKALPTGALNREAQQDALAALATLGFKTDPARKVLTKLGAELPPAEQTAENLIRRALAVLNS